eukprot:GHUV01018840.1.p1 GENE.GHUV01018840.1~~GHUV01018840.1.p1  ORF type:complete len:411 (+),score=69.93 GHUV01018840.1:2014-3246(+)
MDCACFPRADNPEGVHVFFLDQLHSGTTAKPLLVASVPLGCSPTQASSVCGISSARTRHLYNPVNSRLTHLPYYLCRIMTQLRYNEELMHKFFAASASVTDTMCPTDPENPNCAVCLFPEFSTLISAFFALMYLVVLWTVLGRIANAAINKMLARRIRLLQICITLFFCASITLRGVTVVNIDPYSLDFVALWLANVVVGSGLILVVSAILVWVPVYDGRLANQRLGSLSVASSSLYNAPTELLPLVGYRSSGYSHDAASSDYGDYGGSQTGDQLISNPLAALAEDADSAAAGAAILGPGVSDPAGITAASDRGMISHRGPSLGLSESGMLHRPLGAGAAGLGSAASSGSAAVAAGQDTIFVPTLSGSQVQPAVVVVSGSSGGSRAAQRRRGSHRAATPEDCESQTDSLM